MNDNNSLSKELIERMIKDRKVRIGITKQSHNLFFHFYFAHYVKYKTAEFQNEIFEITQNESIGNVYIVAFRGCGKSTIITTSYPVWAILGQQQKKFVLILCQTRAQAKQHMMNLRGELENNTLLKNDLGPFKEDSDEWGSASLVFSNMNARITVASVEQSIRGLRHNQHRPDLIICDDIENLISTKTREGRNKTYDWLSGEVFPAGDNNTRLIIVGNLLHEDSVLMRIKENIQENKIDGVFKEYPLIKDEQILWTGKYPTFEDIEKEKRKIGNEYSWKREFLLQIVPNEEQVILREWIQYYDVLPMKKDIYEHQVSNIEVWIGVDLAISKTKTADYTAFIPVLLYESKLNYYEIYVLPNITNRKMNFPETVDLCKSYDRTFTGEFSSSHPTFIIEDVAYQRALPEQLIDEGIWNVKASRPGTTDKRSRLILTANMIKIGRIKFPKTGAEDLINQIIHFGVEKHDDLADAFSIVINNIISDPPKIPRIYYLG